MYVGIVTLPTTFVWILITGVNKTDFNKPIYLYNFDCKINYENRKTTLHQISKSKF